MAQTIRIEPAKVGDGQATEQAGTKAGVVKEGLDAARREYERRRAARA